VKLIAGQINIQAPLKCPLREKMMYTKLAMMSKKGRMRKAG
jgi:hypothetical protein